MKNETVTIEIDLDKEPQEVLEQFITATMQFCDATNTNMLGIQDAFNKVSNLLMSLNSTLQAKIKAYDSMLGDAERRINKLENASATRPAQPPTLN